MRWLVVAAAVALAGCGAEGPLQRTEPSGGEGGRAFVASGCGSCHTLAAAGTDGTSGPDLDAARPTFEAAERVIADGRGAMPPYRGELRLEEIRALARYVADSTR